MDAKYTIDLHIEAVYEIDPEDQDQIKTEEEYAHDMIEFIADEVVTANGKARCDVMNVKREFL